MVAFFASVLVSIGLFGVGIWYMHRRPADKKGTWVFHCHILNHAERETGMFGMVTAVVVQ